MTENKEIIAAHDLQHLLKGIDGSPSLAMLNIVLTDTLGMAMHNAVTTQHNAQILNSAITTAICTRIIAVNGTGRPRPSASANFAMSAASNGLASAADGTGTAGDKTTKK